MGKPELPTAQVEPRNLGEHVNRARGSMAATSKRVVDHFKQEVPANQVGPLILGAIAIGGLMLALRHLLF